MLKRLLRWAAGGVLAMLVVAGLAVGVLALPPVQRATGAALLRWVDGATTWRVGAGEVALRPWPARLEVRRLTVAPADEAPVATAERLEVRWRWIALLGSSPRVRRVVVDGLTWRQPEAAPAGGGLPAPAPGELLRRFEIGRLVVRGAAGSVAFGGVAVHAAGVRVDASLVASRARAVVRAASLELERAGRRLPLGAFAAVLAATPGGVTLESATLEGAGIRARLQATATGPDWQSGLTAQADLEVPVDTVAGLWDPELAGRLAVAGRLRLRGDLQWRAGEPVTMRLQGAGEDLEVAGLGIAGIDLGMAGGTAWGRVSGDGWGTVAAWGAPAAGPWRAVVQLNGAPLDGLRPLLAANITAGVPTGLRASGSASLEVPLPLTVSTVTGALELRLGGPPGMRVALDGTVADGQLDLRAGEAELGGATVRAKGRLGLAGSDDLQVELWAPDPAATLAAMRGLGAPLPGLPLAGGPLLARATLRGPWRAPRLEGGALWRRPQAAGRSLNVAALTIGGGLDRLAWRLAAVAEGGGTMQAAGAAVPRAPLVTADWSVTELPAAGVAAFAAPGLATDAGGVLDGVGTFTWAGGTAAEASGVISWRCPRWGELAADDLAVAVTADPGGLLVHQARLGVAGGEVTAVGAVALAAGEPSFEIRLAWRGLHPERLAPGLAGLVAGELRGGALVSGTVAAPHVSGRAHFEAADPTGPLGPVDVAFELKDGRVGLVGGSLRTAAGSLTAEATADLGAFAPLRQLWPDAPRGPAAVHVEGHGLDAAPLLAGIAALPSGAQLSGGVVLDGRWEPESGAWPELHLELPDLAIGAGGERLVARSAPVLELEGGVARLEPTKLDGPNTSVSLEGSADLTAGTVTAALHGTLAADLVAAALPQMRVRGPVSVSLDVKGPWREPVGHLTIDHHGGALMMADPAVELTDLHLELRLANGVLDVDDGSAQLNEGEVTIGGGWDPTVQQGIVAELDHVSFLLPYGILSRWDGLLAVEPRPNGRLAVVGDLYLDRGLWDRDVDLAKMLAEQVAGAAPEVPDYSLERIALNLEVHGRGGIHVDNNLGDMRLRWRTLHVGGSLLTPTMEGQITVVPGGELRLGGSAVAIERGSLDFSGDPGGEPTVEIVTSTPMFGSGSSSTQRLSLSDLVQAGAASAVAQAFGVRNTTLRPVDIAAETNTDPATRFTVAQFLGPHAVLFLSTDLGDVQQRTTLLQLWRLRGLPGLVLQGFSTTEGDGGTVLERLKWGGGATEDEGPKVGKIVLSGAWPVSERRLRKAADLAKDREYDPFLLFVGEVRLERELAAAGYPQARVQGVAEGNEHRKRLVYTVDPGPHVPVEFRGDDVPDEVRREVAAEHRTGWLEAGSLVTMKNLLEQELAARGYPDAHVTVTAAVGEVVVDVQRGSELQLRGLEIDGVPVESARVVEQLMGSAVQLAALADRDQGAEERLRGLLAAEGFPDAEIASVAVEHVGESSGVVRVEVHAGERATVRRLVIDGDDPLGVVANPGFPLRAGVPLRRAVMDTAERRLRNDYRDAGYPDVKVAVLAARPEGGTADVVVRLDPGSQRTVTRVEVTGLDNLHRSVVQRGITVEQGTRLRPVKLDETAAELGGFAPVDRVDVTWKEDGPTGAAVTVAVTEKPRWTVGAGYRYSTDQGGEVVADLRDDDLLGRGLRADARGRWGQSVRGGYLWLEQPPLPRSNLALGASGAWERTDLSPGWLQSHATLSLEAALRGASASQWRLYLKGERFHVYPEKPDEFLSFDVTTRLVSLGGQVSKDTRDHPFDPRSGYHAALDVSYSPRFLGSDLDYVRALGSFSIATQPWSGWTWAQALRLGLARAITGEAPSTALFLAGGESTVRGFNFNSVGPVEVLGDTVRPLGGGALFVLNEELRIPVSSSWRVAVFTDVGQVWESWSRADTSLAVGAGVGFRLSTPVGMVRGDVAWPVANRARNRGAHLYIGLGQTF